MSETVVYKACNLLRVQIGDLAYAPGWGIDLEMFFDPNVEIQTDVFKKYSIKKMAENGINPVSLVTDEKSLETIFDYVVVDAGKTGGLIS